MFIRKKVGFRGLIEIAQADFANFRSEYLSKYESIF
jgi:hypothetical protein